MPLARMRLTWVHFCTYLWPMNDLLTPEDVEAKASAAGMSIADICKRADVAQSTFSRWKAGKTSPTLTIYKRIVAVLAPAGKAI